MLYEKGKMTINEAMKWPTDKARYDANYETIFIDKKLIKDFPGYWVLKDGRIWSGSNKSNHKKGKFLKPYLRKGHFSVLLYKEGKSFLKSVCRLVLETYVGLCPKNMEACHNDGNPTNNDLNNLRWDTHSNNMKDSVEHGTNVGLRRGERANSAKLTDENVNLIKKLYQLGKYNQKELAIKFNTSQPNISLIINKKSRVENCICGNRGYLVDNKISTKCLLCEIQRQRK